MPVAQGIEASRWLLQQDVKIDEANCSQGLEALRAYSYAFDEETRCFSNRPEHGWSSRRSRFVEVPRHGGARSDSPDASGARETEAGHEAGALPGHAGEALRGPRGAKGKRQRIA